MKLRDLREEEPLSLADAAVFLGKITGNKPHVSTLWRWCQKGCKGVRLDSICIGGKRFVTVTAIERFVEASTASRAAATGQLGEPVATAAVSPGKGMLAHVMRHNERRRQEIEAARRQLDEITGAAKPSMPTTRSA